MKNPKAYPTWEHRLWTVRKHGAAAASELLLCEKFLKFDERNFHCWGYRRHMARAAQAEGTGELAQLGQRKRTCMRELADTSYRWQVVVTPMS
jgi:geranylgeranyl transferase type-2 subunit alpha